MSNVANQFPRLIAALEAAILAGWAVKQGQWTQDYLKHGDQCAVRIGAFVTEIASNLNVSQACTRRWLHAAEKASLVISNPCTGGCTRWWPVGFAATLLQKGAAACRICGCTETQACPGGCYWVEPDLCSACAEAPLPFDHPK